MDALLLDPYPFEIWVANRTDGIVGSGTLNDPWNASTAAAFDQLMTTIGNLPPEKVGVVHLGPGIFETYGFNSRTGAGWQPRQGTRIIGSAIDATVLKLVGATESSVATHYFIVGHAISNVASQRDYFEISHMTLDCDLANQTGTQVACGGIRLAGHHVKVHRIKVKNWGTKTTSMPCRAISVIAGEPRSPVTADDEFKNCGIEACMVVEPVAPPANGILTALHVGSKLLTELSSEPGTENERFGKGPYIRNCFVDGGSLGGAALTTDIRGISMSWCQGGVVEGNQIHNVQWGGPYIEKSSIRSLIIRNNIYKNVRKGPHWKLGALLTPSSYTLNALSIANGVGTGTTSAAHSLALGDRVKIVTTGNSYNGMFEVTGIPDNTHFEFKTTAANGTPTPSSIQKVFGAANILVEGNAIELAQLTDAGPTPPQPVGIHFHDQTAAQPPDYVHREIIVRENTIKYLDVAFESTYTGYGVEIEGAKYAHILDNVIESAVDDPIRHKRCGVAKYQSNRTPSGVLLEGFDGTSRYNEMETDAEFALLVGLSK